MQLATEEQLVREAGTFTPSGAASRTPGELATIVSRFASSEGWMDRVRLRTKHRWYERLCHGLDHDIRVISWLPGQATGFRDHGESSGAFVVATGVPYRIVEPVSPARFVCCIARAGGRRAYVLSTNVAYG